MKVFLKYILLPLLVILGIYVLLCLGGPKNFDIEEDINIEAPAPVIYNLVNSLKKSESWNEWSLNDTSMVTTYNDILRGVGAESSWKSATQGAGKQKIIQVEKNKSVKSSLEFEDWDGINHAEFILTPDGKETETSWNFVSGSDTPFLFRGMMLVMGMSGEMKDNYKNGLKNIKRIAEERAKKNLYNNYEIMEKSIPEKNFVLNRQEVNVENIQQFYATNLGALFGKVQTSGVEMAGMPCGLFFKDMDSRAKTLDMAAAIPVSKPLSIEGASSLQIIERNAIQVDYYGDYHGTVTAHEAIKEYMLDKGYFQDPPIIEEYVTDPSTQKDPNQWLTRVIYYYSD